LPHIFDRFYRSDSSRSKTMSEGYGLGLAIAKKIADSLDGGIEVRSAPDKGSTFTILLPVA
jgi:signal transduction histidine kinase